MSKPLRVLIVEDSVDDVSLLLRELGRNNYEVAYERVESAQGMKAALEQQEWDLVLCDFSLPHFSAPEALNVLRSAGSDLPFIILSGTINEETAVASLKAGAHDFVVKGNFARLAPAIERELQDARIRREHRQAEEALREKERLLSEAQRIGHIGSWSYNIPADTLQYSDEMYNLLDISPKEFEHNRAGFLNLVSSLDRDETAKWLEDVKSGRIARELTFRILRKNGELRYLHARGANVFDKEGTPVRFVGTMQDVTERKLAEIQIQQQLDHLIALRKIDQAITSSFNLGYTLNTVLAQALEQLQVDAADILLLDPEKGWLEHAASRGFRTPAIRTARLRLGEGHAGRAAQERRLIRIPDLQAQPMLRSSMLQAEGFACYFSLPLISKGFVRGVLELFHRVPLQPYPEWFDFLETLGGQAAIAIDNATLFESLQRTNVELENAYDATIEGWSRALDLRDRETEGHTQRVTGMTVHLARAMNFSEEDLVHIRRGGLLHDIGKMGIPDRILLKEGPLTREEWAIMRQHPQFALDLLYPIHYLRPALDIPYCHHEKWDGTGYPRGLKGGEIPLSARIFAAADVWDALTSDRPYRKAWSRPKSLEYIQSSSGTHFDPQVVEVFIQYMNLQDATSDQPPAN